MIPLEMLRGMTEAVTQALHHQDKYAVLNVIARYSSQGLGTDVVTIYPYRDEEGVFETPPIWIGDIKHPEYMARRIYPDDIPRRILEAEEKYHYWREADQYAFLTGKVGMRDAEDPARERFVTREQIASSAAVKLTVGDRPVGVMFFNFRRPQEFASEQRQVVEALSNYTALALETLASYRKIRETASAEEAERWNRELHDSVIQVLAGGVLANAGILKNQLRRQDYAKALASVQRLEKAAEYVIDEVQDIREELANRTLARKGLVPALQEYLQFISEHASDPLRVMFDYDELGNLAPEVEHALYRIAQGALSNVVKSAKATDVRTRLHRRADEVTLVVEDNGRGFDVAATLPESFGLMSMSTRAGAISGHLSIESQAGQGTRVMVAIPLDPKE